MAERGSTIFSYLNFPGHENSFAIMVANHNLLRIYMLILILIGCLQTNG